MLSFLTDTAVRDKVTSSDAIVSCGNMAPLKDALRLMKQHNILSLPVLNDKQEIESVIGAVNIVDFVAYQSEQSTEESLHHSVIDFKNLTEESTIVWAFPGHASLGSLLEVFCGGLHRVLVTSSTQPVSHVRVNDLMEEGFAPVPQASVVGIISQSDLLKIMLQNVEKQLEHPDNFASNSLSALGLVRGPSPKLSVNGSSTALDAFRRIAIRDVSGVAVVSDSGAVIGNLSASSLRGLWHETKATLQEALNVPVLEFVKTQASRDTKVFSLSPESTLLDAMRILVKERIHRVWVVTPENRVEGVVTITDVIEVFWKAVLSATSCT